MIFTFSPLANCITIKRNSKICVTATRAQTERDKAFAENQNKMMAMILDIQQNVQRLAVHLDMRKKIRIDDYFPVKQDSDLQKFLDKTDGLYILRREEFENMLYNNLTKSMKLKRAFEATLLSTLFSREFISSHRWPGLG